MAVCLTAILASLFSSQVVIANLIEVGAQVDLGNRISMTLGDLGILETLVPVLIICFTIGFTVAYYCQKHLGGKRIFWFIIAGGSAFLSTLLIMRWQLQLSPVAGARTLAGLSLQTLAGALGGAVFALSGKNKANREKIEQSHATTL